MNRAFALLALCAAGCFDPQVADGQFACAPDDRSCPPSFSCDPCTWRCVRAPSTTCDDLSVVDAPVLDMAVAADFATPDLATPDLTTPRDLAIPDLAHPDLAMPDFATPDFAMPDFAMPDLAMPDFAMPDLVPSPDFAAPPDLVPCLQSLTGVGTGDFTIRFTLQIPSGWAELTALANQRDVCNAFVGWEVRLNANGTLRVELDQNAMPDTQAASSGTTPIVDGAPHQILITRTGGNLLRVFIDGTLNLYNTSASENLYGTLPRLVIGDSVCEGKDGTWPLWESGGSVTNLCMTF